jgi:hypothetical protein
MRRKFDNSMLSARITRQRITPFGSAHFSGFCGRWSPQNFSNGGGNTRQLRQGQRNLVVVRTIRLDNDDTLVGSDRIGHGKCQGQIAISVLLRVYESRADPSTEHSLHAVTDHNSRLGGLAFRVFSLHIIVSKRMHSVLTSL